MSFQAIELLAISLGVAIFIAILLIVVNCITACYQNCSSNRRKSSDVEKLPDDYVNEIHRLLDRHKRIMNEYDCPENVDDYGKSYHPILTESMIGTPVKMRSRSNSCKLQKLKDELEEYRIEYDDVDYPEKEDCEAKRRTWGGLNDSVFDPVELPNSTDAQVQTTGTLHRMNVPGQVMKIETTV